MRLPFRPRPSREELANQPLHVIIRDFPETLEAFRAHGVLPEELGDLTMRDLDGRDDLLDGLEASTAWRPGRVRA
jgi:hypothetical protein